MERLSQPTLTAALTQHARHTPGQTALVFVRDNEAEQTVTYEQFYQQAQAYARALQAVGIQAGDLTILVLKHSPELLSAFWGAMYLGATASIFPFLTEKLDPVIYMQRVKALVSHSQARAVITFPEFEEPLRRLLGDVRCAVMSTAALQPLNDAEAQNPVEAPESPTSIAFLQHSSGTTGLQKGVALSHQAVLNQVAAYSRAIDLRADDVIVSWLPLYHDMGLIAGFVMPLVTGTPLVLMSPFKWVADPKQLLQAIHRHRGTLCWLPNFAYNHSQRAIRPKDIGEVRLDRMRAFINCSEPVFLDSHQRFLEKFAPYGARPEMLQVCYAMAENTFAVTQTRMGSPAAVDWVETRALQEQRLALPAEDGAPNATPMVSCGSPIDGTEICVVDEHGHALEERHVGEIALRSSCMLSAYYRRPEITRQAIRHGWYHTGDMGYLADGQLYITGRKKDLIINGGKNIYPQDLEAIANSLPGLVPGRNVAFGLMDKTLGSENIVMVCELEDDHLPEEQQHALEMELRKRVVQRSEVTLWDVQLVGRKWLIKTSSGKISRPANRDKYLQMFGTLS